MQRKAGSNPSLSIFKKSPRTFLKTFLRNVSFPTTSRFLTARQFTRRQGGRHRRKIDALPSLALYRRLEVKHPSGRDLDGLGLSHGTYYTRFPWHAQRHLAHHLTGGHKGAPLEQFYLVLSDFALLRFS